MTEHNTHGAGGYERTDANVRGLTGFAVGLVLLMLVGMFAMRMFYVQMAEHQVRTDPALSPLAAQLPDHPPDPRLQVMPAADLQQIRAEEQEKLTSYGWVEPNAGVVRIPVERAMELVVERGLPVRSEVKKQGSEEMRK